MYFLIYCFASMLMQHNFCPKAQRGNFYLILYPVILNA